MPTTQEETRARVLDLRYDILDIVLPHPLIPELIDKFIPPFCPKCAYFHTPQPRPTARSPWLYYSRVWPSAWTWNSMDVNLYNASQLRLADMWKTGSQMICSQIPLLQEMRDSGSCGWSLLFPPNFDTRRTQPIEEIVANCEMDFIILENSEFLPEDYRMQLLNHCFKFPVVELHSFQQVNWTQLTFSTAARVQVLKLVKVNLDKKDITNLLNSLTSLKELILSKMESQNGNEIAIAIGEYLRNSNATLKVLVMNEVRGFGKSGLRGLVHGLQTNKTLSVLDLSSNNLNQSESVKDKWSAGAYGIACPINEWVWIVKGMIENSSLCSIDFSFNGLAGKVTEILGAFDKYIPLDSPLLEIKLDCSAPKHPVFDFEITLVNKIKSHIQRLKTRTPGMNIILQ